MIFVVGSGPAGVSCAQGLLAAGADVTLIDSGLVLEPSNEAKLQALINIEPASWTKESTAFLSDIAGVGTSGIPLKLTYGSDYPYRAVPGSTPVSCEAAETKASYARGGFSNVWGSAVLPYRDADLGEWPIKLADLAPGYRAVLNWMPLSARPDDLATLFPLFSDKYSLLPLSRQAASLLGDLEKRKAALHNQGVMFGASRLAVRANALDHAPGCISCGLCMYGCPHRLIYSSSSTVDSLLAHPRFRYQNGLTVRSVRESATGVTLDAIDLNGNATTLTGDRVFLAAGVLETTSILLRSLGQYNTPVTLKDSQYFLLPLLRLKGTSEVSTERLHTLAQLFLEVLDPAISPYTIHLQTYTYNELFREPVVAKLRAAKSLFPLETFLGRLLLFQGYLHSAHSASVSATLSHTADGDRLLLTGVPNPETAPMLRKLIKKFARLIPSTGLFPLFPLLQPGDPGRGFHSGGTFPMREHPKQNETDVFGRPAGLSKIHAVDSTVFPSIPATTITFTSMANAYRIGSQLEHYA